MMNLLATNSGLYIWLTVLIVFILGIAIFVGFVPVNIWIKALVSGAHVSTGRLIGMRLRHVEINKLIDSYINAKKAGLDINIEELETHYLAGGNVERVVNALIIAHGARINLNIKDAKAIDLANRNILEAVKNSVTPVVIITPPINAVAKNGVELIVVAKVTVKYNISKLIGGAGPDTIIARVGEGIVTTVGSSEHHRDVLEHPDRISKVLLEKKLDENTAFSIVSIDIADVNVGGNIGAKLHAEQARADMEIARAKAEERRSMAYAAEQEMKAKTQEMKAKLLSAESEIPKAIYNAFMAGNLGVLDYYKMQNVISDTVMRNSLAKSNLSITDSNKK